MFSWLTWSVRSCFSCWVKTTVVEGIRTLKPRVGILGKEIDYTGPYDQKNCPKTFQNTSFSVSMGFLSFPKTLCRATPPPTDPLPLATKELQNSGDGRRMPRLSTTQLSESNWSSLSSRHAVQGVQSASHSLQVSPRVEWDAVDPNKDGHEFPIRDGLVSSPSQNTPGQCVPLGHSDFFGRSISSLDIS